MPKGAKGVYFHHHAEQVARFNPAIMEDVVAAVSRVDVALALERKRRGEPRGLDPAFFNDALRRAFAEVNGVQGRSKPAWTFEARIRDGVVWDHGTHHKAKVAGFDIGNYDPAHNVAALRNLCFGRRVLRDGQTVWEKAQSAFPHWKSYMLKQAAGTAGDDVVTPKTYPTVIGEIQCGNWALVHRDFMKLLQAERELAKSDDELDLFVYICPTGTLSEFMSDGTVSFGKTLQYLNHFRSVITVPTVVVGVDVEMDLTGGGRTGPVSEELKRKLRSRVTVHPLLDEIAPTMDEPDDEQATLPEA